MAGGTGWTVEWYRTARGEAPAQTFLASLAGPLQDEAAALLVLAESRGHSLREPHSKSLGDGLFSCVGDAACDSSIRFAPDNGSSCSMASSRSGGRFRLRSSLGCGGISERSSMGGVSATRERKERRWVMTKTKRPTSDFRVWLEEQYRHDPGMEARVDALVAEMALEQDLVALRESAGVSQRALAKRLGVSQPAIAKLESGKVKNVGVVTLARYAAALGGRVHIEITRAAAWSARKSATPARRREGHARRPATRPSVL